MTLNELLTNIQELALSNKQIKAVQTGSKFDVGVAKKDEYPCLWIEIPILINYNDNRFKTFTFALNFLSLCKADDLTDAILKTSDMEIVSDDVLQAIKYKYTHIGIENITGLTLKSFSDDDLVGVRVELTFMLGRDCDWREHFDKAIISEIE
jgi:hypothetical protein